MQVSESSEDTYSLDYLNSQINEDLISRISQYELQKIQNILEILNEDVIDMPRLKECANLGIPDECIGLRAIVWKIILGYLKPNKSTWTRILKERRATYNQFLDEFLRKQKTPPQQIIDEHEEEEIKRQKQEEEEVLQNKQNKEGGFFSEGMKKQSSQKEGLNQIAFNPPLPYRSSQGSALKSKMQFTKVVDHPLSKCSRSNWNSFFQDSELFTQIEKDTERTRADMHFFISHTQRKVRLQIPFVTQIRQEKKKKNISPEERHCEVLSRILFIYAKLNPVIQYVQGMNEILAPIYYVFQKERAFPLFQEDGFVQIEADSFFCFIIIMGLLKDRFMRQMDEYQQGIKYQCLEFNSYVKAFDNDLWFHFEQLQIDPQYYSLRWLLLLFTQEFQLQDVIRLWDTLLGRKDILNYVSYIGLAILKINRSYLMDDDFAIVMTKLQRIESMNVLEIIKEAALIEELHLNKQRLIENDFFS